MTDAIVPVCSHDWIIILDIDHTPMVEICTRCGEKRDPVVESAKRQTVFIGDLSAVFYQLGIAMGNAAQVITDAWIVNWFSGGNDGKSEKHGT